MQTHRRHLDISYSESPIQILGRWMGRKFFSVFMGIGLSLIWMFAFYVILISLKAMAGGYSPNRREMACYEAIGGWKVAVVIYLAGAVVMFFFAFASVKQRTK